MEGPQSQEETAGANNLKGMLRVLMGPLRVLGGIVLFVLAYSVWMGLTLAVHYIPVIYLHVEHEQGDFFISMLWGLGLTALILVTVYLILPVRKDQMRDALVQAAGLVMVAYPFMIVDATYEWNPTYTYRWPVSVTFGMETPYWLTYYIIGALFLVQPLLRGGDHPSEDPHSAQNAAEFCLALPTMMATLLLMFVNPFTETYIFILIIALLVVTLFTATYAILPKAPGIKRIRLP